MVYANTSFPNNTSDIKKAKIVVFGVPIDSTVDYLPGTRFGPKIIREAANFIEPFDIEIKKNILEEIKIIDDGDLEPVRGSVEKTILSVSDKINELFKRKKFPLMLGGEHSITLGAIKALPNGARVISFDAHYDLKEIWEGSEYTHNTWLRRGSEIIKKERICIIGVRSGDEFECEYSNGILVNPSFDNLEKFVKGKDVYLTVDMDVFDPSIAPGVGTPEPNGLSYKDFIERLRIICDFGNVIGMDLTEARPLGENKITEILAAKVIFKTILEEFR